MTNHPTRAEGGAERPYVRERGEAYGIGEPVTCERCHGRVYAVERYGGIEVYHDGIVSGYTTGEIKRIGHGVWSFGVLRVTRASLDEPCPLGGELKPYAEVLP
jgi:hypothetical protein